MCDCCWIDIESRETIYITGIVKLIVFKKMFTYYMLHMCVNLLRNYLDIIRYMHDELLRFLQPLYSVLERNNITYLKISKICA